MSLNIEIIPAFQDNYIFLLTCIETQEVAVVDPGDAQVVEVALLGRRLDKIFNTHHHADHVGGNSQLVKLYGCDVYGSQYDERRIPEVTSICKEGDEVWVGNCKAKVLDVKGHTLGHIAYYFEDEGVVFVGDTLFVGGCGRLFEGSYEDMFNSLVKLKKLPDDVKVYCAHEYTKSNLTFSLNYSNEARYANSLREVRRMREQNMPTVPTTIRAELEHNIFFRCQDVDQFARVREAKDHF